MELGLYFSRRMHEFMHEPCLMAGCQTAPPVPHGMRRPYAPTSWADAMRAARQRRQNNDTPKGFQDKTAGAPDEPAGQSCRYAAFVYPPNDAINATCVGMDTTVRVCANNDDEAQEIARHPYVKWIELSLKDNRESFPDPSLVMPLRFDGDVKITFFAPELICCI